MSSTQVHLGPRTANIRTARYGLLAVSMVKLLGISAGGNLVQVSDYILLYYYKCSSSTRQVASYSGLQIRDGMDHVWREEIPLCNLKYR